MAAHPKLTPEVQQAICKALELGLPRRRAAWKAGIDEGTVSRWYRGGSADDAPPRLRDFRAAVEKAEATHQEKLIKRANRVERPLAILGRRYPDEWGRRDNVEADDAESKAADAAATRQLLMDRLEKLFRAVPVSPAGGA